MIETSYQVSRAKMKTELGIDDINRVRTSYNGPIGKRRLDVCERNYKLAVTSFQKALEAARKNSFAKNRMEMSNGIQTGLEAVRQCEDGWVKNGPIQQSPLTFTLGRVNRLYLISLVCLSRLSKSP